MKCNGHLTESKLRAFLAPKYQAKNQNKIQEYTTASACTTSMTNQCLINYAWLNGIQSDLRGASKLGLLVAQGC